MKRGAIVRRIRRRRFRLARETPRLTRAGRFSASCRHLPNVLVSNENLLGALPRRLDVSGLYPFALAAMVAGMEAAGAAVRVVFYQRDYHGWAGSLQRDRFPHLEPAPITEFHDRNALPESWDGVLAEFRGSLGPA